MRRRFNTASHIEIEIQIPAADEPVAATCMYNVAPLPDKQRRIDLQAVSCDGRRVPLDGLDVTGIEEQIEYELLSLAAEAVAEGMKDAA
jgi:hypothetical protein